MGVVENHMSIALTISGLLLIDSWYQESYVSSISMHCFDIIRNSIIRAKSFHVQKRAWPKITQALL